MLPEWIRLDVYVDYDGCDDDDDQELQDCGMGYGG